MVKRKVTDEYIRNLEKPILKDKQKFQLIRDTKDNIVVRHYGSGGVIFWAYYWFRGQTIYYNLGKWKENVFDSNDARAEARRIRVEFIDKGKDPRIAKKQQRIEAYRQQILEMKKIMFKNLIEKYIEVGMPRVASTSTGTVTSSSAKNFAYLLIGKHRAAGLKFFDDDKGDGHIVRRDENLRGWEQYWINNTSKKAPRCVYDSILGHSYLTDIKRPRVTSFLNKIPTIEMKRHFKNAISNVISWGIDNEFFGDDPPTNPAYGIKLRRNIVESTHKKIKTFTPEELKQIWDTCDELKQTYPFQTTLIKLMLTTSLRKQEALKLQWTHIKEEEGIIEVPTSSNKIRVNQEIDITPALQVVIDELKELKVNYPWSKFLPWCFPSIKVRNKNMKDNSKPYFSKKFPHASRLKDAKNCWRDIKHLTGIKGSMNMFKKTHHNLAKTVTSDPYELIGLTRHTNTKTLEKHYLHQDLGKRKKQANLVGEKLLKIVK